MVGGGGDVWSAVAARRECGLTSPAVRLPPSALFEEDPRLWCLTWVLERPLGLRRRRRRSLLLSAARSLCSAFQAACRALPTPLPHSRHLRVVPVFLQAARRTLHFPESAARRLSLEAVLR